MVCAAKGYPLVITMAESFSVERRKLMRFLGAKVILTPAPLGATGMIAKGQGAGRGQWLVHDAASSRTRPTRTTTPRPLRRKSSSDFEGEKLDYWVTGFGTGGTLKGVGRRAAEERPETKIVVCRTRNGADADLARGAGRAMLMARRRPAMRPGSRIRIQGWSPDFIPKITGDAVDRQADRRNRRRFPGPRGMKMSRELAQQGRHFRRHHRRRHLRRRRSRSPQKAAQGSTILVHAARHRRALSLDAAVCRYPRRYDRGRGGDLAFDAGLAAAAQGRCVVITRPSDQ